MAKFFSASLHTIKTSNCNRKIYNYLYYILFQRVINVSNDYKNSLAYKQFKCKSLIDSISLNRNIFLLNVRVMIDWGVFLSTDFTDRHHYASHWVCRVTRLDKPLKAAQMTSLVLVNLTAFSLWYYIYMYIYHSWWLQLENSKLLAKNDKFFSRALHQAILCNLVSKSRAHIH